MKLSLLYSLIGILVFFSAGSAQYISKYEQPISAPYFFTPTPDSLLYLNEDSLIAAQIGTRRYDDPSPEIHHDRDGQFHDHSRYRSDL
jgi:hypothetical protein